MQHDEQRRQPTATRAAACDAEMRDADHGLRGDSGNWAAARAVLEHRRVVWVIDILLLVIAVGAALASAPTLV